MTDLINELRAERDRLKDELAVMKVVCEHQERDLWESRNAHVTLAETHARCAERIATLESEVDRLNAELAALRAETDKERDAWFATLARANKELAALRGGIDLVDRMHRKASSERDALRAEFERLSAVIL